MYLRYLMLVKIESSEISLSKCLLLVFGNQLIFILTDIILNFNSLFLDCLEYSQYITWSSTIKRILVFLFSTYIFPSFLFLYCTGSDPQTMENRVTTADILLLMLVTGVILLIFHHKLCYML